ncbi:Putative porin [Herminiimonas arsenicoxydans]|uniref:Porin n=1 Tax=Herminiimonas arsenicoxydans TaxID=204773 RepID=A4G840_HERAR|nr:Putative porin [Herminiimonas arsenicoxydans]
MTARNFVVLVAALTLYTGVLQNAGAQNGVTIYGIADVAMVYSSNQGGASNTYMRSGNLAGSRIGFKGTEDLGGGTQAIFQLESGFNLDTGEMSSSSTLFNRQAFVGINNTRYGALTAGRQYTPYYLFVGPIGPTNSLTGATGAHPGDIDGLDTTIRSNNSITYTSPVWNGLQVSALAGFGETAGDMGSGRTISAAIKYDINNWNFALGYQRLNNSNNPGGVWSPNASANFNTSPVNNGYLSADSAQYLAGAARYTMGKVIVGANASRVEYRPNGNSLFTQKATFDTLGLLTGYQMTPVFFVSVGYSYTKEKAANGISDPAKYHQLALEQTYSFSKRTAIYFLEAYQVAKGNTLGLGGSGPVRAVAVVGDSQNGTPSDGANQAVFMVGIRHSF